MSDLTSSQMGKKGQQVLKKKHGKGYGDLMASKARKSHETQRNNIRVGLTESLGYLPTEEEVQDAYSKVMRDRALKRRKDA